jgi:glycosyltransferase involved in cell wall biosynthesis
MTSAVVLDPGLHAIGGHHHSAYVRLRQELSLRSVKYRYVASTRTDADMLRDDSRLWPGFSRCVYGRSIWTHPQFLEDVEVTSSELRRALGWRWRRPDLFIVPCADQVLTLALAQYLAGQDCRWRPQIIIWLLYGPHCKRSLEDAETGRLVHEHQRALSSLGSAVRRPADLNILCETNSMAAYYSAATGQKISVAPGPGISWAPTARSASQTLSQPTVLCVGHANAAKGYQLLPDAIERVLSSGLNVKFLIHGNVQDTDAAEVRDSMERLRQLAHVSESVVVRTNALGPNEYRDWLCQADVVLLPYCPEIYRSRGSGVFADAEKLGIPVIAPRTCSFATSGIASGRVAPIGDHDSESVAEAILYALRSLSSLTAAARAFASTHADLLGAVLDSHLSRRACPVG